MAPPNSRATLKQYALKQLGFPVAQVNVTDDQMEMLLDDAIQYFHEWSSDGFIRWYHSYQITADDLENKYITLPDYILSVTRVFPLSETSRGNMFDIRYQLRLSDVYGLHTAQSPGFDLTNYNIIMQYLEMIEFNLSGEQSYAFNRLSNQLHIHVEWGDVFSEGTWIMLETFRTVAPLTGSGEDAVGFSKVYNDIFLKTYFTLLVKRQWGNNLKKFDGQQLPGGLVVQGQKIYDEAMAELKQFEDDIFEKYQLPPGFYQG